MCENAEVGKGIEKTFAAYTRSVLHAQYNVDPVGVKKKDQSNVDPVGVITV